MTNLFLKYLVDSYQKTTEKTNTNGPVITISREHGCHGSEISQLLLKRINSKTKGKSEWNLISKEIFDEASKELPILPEQVRKLLFSKVKNVLEEIIASYTDKNFIHNIRLIAVFKRVMKTIAQKGNVIILGRAGFAIAKNIPESLHINLYAPMDWRVNMISKKRNISLQKAKEEIEEVDQRRAKFILQVDKTNYPDYQKFDLLFNCSTFSIEEITDFIMAAAEKKGLFKS